MENVHSQDTWAQFSSTDEGGADGELWKVTQTIFWKCGWGKNRGYPPLTFKLSFWRPQEEAEAASDQSLREFEGATLRYASINLKYLLLLSCRQVFGSFGKKCHILIFSPSLTL